MRLPTLLPEQYSPRQKELADRIGGKRGRVGGPFACWLHSPELCDRVEALATFATSDSALSVKLRELCLMIAARFWGAQDSWLAHVDKAVAAGLPAEVIEALAEYRAPAFQADDERVVYQFCKELLNDQFVSDGTYAQAQQLLGDKGVVDLVGCLGTFTLMAFCLNAFQVSGDPARQPPFADIRAFTRVGPRKTLG